MRSARRADRRTVPPRIVAHHARKLHPPNDRERTTGVWQQGALDKEQKDRRVQTRPTILPRVFSAYCRNVAMRRQSAKDAPTRLHRAVVRSGPFYRPTIWFEVFQRVFFAVFNGNPVRFATSPTTIFTPTLLPNFRR